MDNDFFKANVPSEVQDAMAQAAADIKAGKKEVKSYFDFKDDNEFNDYLAQAQ